MKSNTIESIREMILETHIPITETGCWLTEGYVDKDGYPLIKFNGKTERLSRMVLRIFNGEDLSDKQALHICDVPSCVNPDHLYAGTSTDNNRDTVRRNRYVAAKPLIDDEEVVVLLGRGHTQREIAVKLGFSEACVSVSKKRSGYEL